MTKVTSLQNQTYMHSPKNKPQSSPSFKNNSIQGAKLTQAAVDNFVYKKTGVYGWVSNLFDRTQGELQNQIGTAVFTATLAPFVIANNPFSKQDKDTRKYSAWRQPISAVIALGITAPVTYFSEKALNKFSQTGNVLAADLRIMKPDSEYKKEYKKLQAQAYQNEATRDEFSSKYPDLKSFAKEKNDILAEKFAQKYVVCDSKAALREAEATMSGAKLEKFKKDLLYYNLDNVKFQDFAEREFGFEFIKTEGTKILKESAYKKRLETITAIDFLKKLGIINDSVKNKDLVLHLIKNRGSEKSKIVADLLNLKEHEALELTEVNAKLSSRIAELMNNSKTGDKDISLKKLLELLDIEESFKGDLDPMLRKQILQELNSKNIKNAENLFLTNDKESNLLKDSLVKLRDAFKDMKMKVKNPLTGKEEITEIGKRSIEDIGKQMTNSKGLKAVKDFSNHSKYTSMIIAVFSTAISCYALNWAYPRIMEALFPDLANNKKGGNK